MSKVFCVIGEIITLSNIPYTAIGGVGASFFSWNLVIIIYNNIDE